MSGETAIVHDPSTYVDHIPFAELAQLRSERVVFVDEIDLPGWPAGRGYWLVLKHEDVDRVVKDAATFSSWLGGTQMRDPGAESDLEFVRKMMLNMDPPEHTRLRRLLAKSFTPKAVSALEEKIAQHVRGIVDTMIDGASSGTCDFVKDVSADLPLLTLADIMGMPSEDRWLMFDWANRVIGWQDPEYSQSFAFDAHSGSAMAQAAMAVRPTPGPDGRMPDPRSREGMPDLYLYARLLGESKRENPGDDVMSILMASMDEVGGQVSYEEFENMFWLFAVAGNETLRNGIPGGMFALATHPEQQRELRADPSLLDSAVEEMLRWWTPVMNFRRTATVDTEIGGVEIAAGDKVVVSFISANRDEDVFTDPDTFDIRRQPNKHLVFGHGPHFCLGAHLARVQMRTMFSELIARTSWIELAGEPMNLRSNFQRGMKYLPISWQA